MNEHEFAQMLAEAKHRIGQDPVERYLTGPCLPS
jgi:hypothetical protein